MSRPTVAILSSVHDVGDARIHRHVAALTAAGYSVEVWATGDAELAPPGVSIHAQPRVGLARRLCRAAGLPWRTRAAILISVDPDVAFACQVRRAFGRVVHVADVHEDYEALLKDRSWARGASALPGRMIALLGRRAAERADLASVADDHLVPHARHRAVVRNVPTLPASSALGGTPRAVYVGDVRSSRGLFAMLSALDQAPDWELDIVGPLAESDAAEATAIVARLGGRVRLHGRRSPTASWEIATGAWAGFVMLEATSAFIDATPSKLYEYLAYGIPVVATPLPHQAEIVQEANAGAIVSDAASAAQVLTSWSADPELPAGLARNARAWAERSPVFAEGSGVLAEQLGQFDPRSQVS